MSDAEDWALVARARAGDMDAFAAIVRRYQSPLIHFIYRMTGSAHDAEDLAQDSFIKLHRYLGSITPGARFSTILFGMARNLTLNWLLDIDSRGRGRHQPLENLSLPSEAAHAAEQVHRGELAAVLQQAIEGLSAEHREVIVLREINGLDYESIAGIAGCQVGTVKSRLARAREQLRLRLIELGVRLR